MAQALRLNQRLVEKNSPDMIVWVTKISGHGSKAQITFVRGRPGGRAEIQSQEEFLRDHKPMTARGDLEVGQTWKKNNTPVECVITRLSGSIACYRFQSDADDEVYTTTREDFLSTFVFWNVPQKVENTADAKKPKANIAVGQVWKSRISHGECVIIKVVGKDVWFHYLGDKVENEEDCFDPEPEFLKNFEFVRDIEGSPKQNISVGQVWKVITGNYECTITKVDGTKIWYHDADSFLLKSRFLENFEFVREAEPPAKTVQQLEQEVAALRLELDMLKAEKEESTIKLITFKLSTLLFNDCISLMKQEGEDDGRNVEITFYDGDNFVFEITGGLSRDNEDEIWFEIPSEHWRDEVFQYREFRRFCDKQSISYEVV